MASRAFWLATIVSPEPHAAVASFTSRMARCCSAVRPRGDWVCDVCLVPCSPRGACVVSPRPLLKPTDLRATLAASTSAHCWAAGLGEVPSSVACFPPFVVTA